MSGCDAALEARVRDQYERYPYPSYSLSEVPKPVMANCDGIARISARLFEGRLDPSTLNVLVAGGGTGEKTIGLGLQLQPYGGTVTHLDLSAMSIDAAKRGAAAAGLDNVRFVQGSITDAPRLFDTERFNYIQCMGVLHHLPDPDAGLAALRDVLAEDGGMSIAVYAKAGRTAVYLLKDALGELVDPADPLDRQLALAQTALDALPDGHWLRFDAAMLAHLERHGLKALLDAVLHAVDHAYTIDSFMALIEDSGLQFVDFTEPWGKIVLDLPQRHGFAPEVTHRLDGMSVMRRRRFLELFDSRLVVHSAYLARSGRRTPMITDDLSFVPSPSRYGTVATKASGAGAVEISDTRFGAIRARIGTAAPRFLQLSDDTRTTGEILEQMIAENPALETTPQDLALRIRNEGWILFLLDIIVFKDRSLLEGEYRLRQAARDMNRPDGR